MIAACLVVAPHVYEVAHLKIWNFKDYWLTYVLVENMRSAEQSICSLLLALYMAGAL